MNFSYTINRFSNVLKIFKIFIILISFHTEDFNFNSLIPIFFSNFFVLFNDCLDLTQFHSLYLKFILQFTNIHLTRLFQLFMY